VPALRASEPAATRPASAPATDSVAPGGGSAWSRLGAEGLSLKELKTRIEIECITEALSNTGGNITRAAEKLGMKRPRLSQLIKEHGISVEGNGR
jgi:sigma-54 specific flagellar transcriptional regulator A